MNNPTAPSADTGESGPQRRGRYRRFGWLTREDVEALCLMPPDMAREYERFLHNQANADARHRAHTVTESDLKVPHADEDSSAVETLHGIRTARWHSGPGGGRHVPHRPAEEAA